MSGIPATSNLPLVNTEFVKKLLMHWLISALRTDNVNTNHKQKRYLPDRGPSLEKIDWYTVFNGKKRVLRKLPKFARGSM
jgi:hypothetical protein